MNEFPIIPVSKLSLSKRKLVFGVGVNDADYVVKPTVNGRLFVCPFYKKWQHMLMRCYDHKYQKNNHTYTGCSVSEEWKIFSKFRSWMIGKDWRGNDLDKDILVKGNKVYSKSACIFVPQEINKLLNDCRLTRGNHPQGVYFDKSRGLFMARISIYSKQKNLGRFKSQIDAFECYKNAKEKHVHEVALSQSEPLRSALLNWRLESC